MTDDQELRLNCLRICVNVAEAKNAYFWINGDGRKEVGMLGNQQTTVSALSAQAALNANTNWGLHAGAQAQGNTQL